LGNVHIQTSPFVKLNIGPDQVISGPFTLRVMSNIDIAHFVIIEQDIITNDTYTVAVGDDPTLSAEYSPPENTNKKIQFLLQAEDAKGNVYVSTPIMVHIVTTKTYGATPLGPQESFRSVIEPMAQKILEQENMSASLQTAQAILESGWGQYLPTDRYTGQVSYNLFGIKGTGQAGMVVSKTSEIYGGIRYSIDANFRAYHTIEESWQDHANLLLLKSWYEPFREVMYDPIQGAWGLYRSGYATTPTYAIQLINLMEQQKLWGLDNVMP
jgi:flagellum-specific peptidoglycan hydrolase FlgJ